MKNSKRDSARWLKFFPDGKTPRYVRCYDNGGRSYDRYFVVYSGRLPAPYQGGCFGVGMNEYPYHPQGFCMHSEFSRSAGSNQNCFDRPKYSHLGKKIAFEDLPEDCRLAVVQDYCYLWDLEYPDWAHNHWRIIMRDGRAKDYFAAKKMMEEYAAI